VRRRRSPTILPILVFLFVGAVASLPRIVVRVLLRVMRVIVAAAIVLPRGRSRSHSDLREESLGLTIPLSVAGAFRGDRSALPKSEN
jgi:hypothetical protein